MDLDVPARDLDPFDEEAEKTLSPGEVEIIDSGCDCFGEVLNSGPQAVLGREFGAGGHQFVALPDEVGTTGLDLLGALGEFGQFDHSDRITVK